MGEKALPRTPSGRAGAGDMGDQDEQEQADEFARQMQGGADGARFGLAGEFVSFLKENKKWWLAPIILSVLLLGLLILLGGTAAAPFIYTLF